MVRMAPTVASTSPSNDEEAVERNRVIEITFNESMDPATIDSTTLTVKQGTAAVNGTVAYSETTATFTAVNVLNALKTYTVTATTDVKSANGIALASDKVWTFTTGGSTTP